ncbi:VWA domain-containing protein [Terracidiphilus sp.]|uniref:VWA domain-containing protein n=1 Tax=Terracidiphilus sp. TaxID=1964191 RepID=UPI003C2427F5
MAARCGSALLLIAGAALTMMGQAAQNVAPTPAVAPQNTPVLQAHATMVLVDVVVTEHDKAIHAIDPHRFHIFEDGREQTVSSFDEHVPPPVGSGASVAQAAHSEPNIYTNIPDAPPSTAVNVLLLDGLNTPLANQVQVRQQMLRYLTQVEPGTQLAIFTLASRLRMVQGFTANVGELTRAMQSSKATPQSSVLLDPAGDQAADSLIGGMASVAASSTAVSAMQQFQADQISYQTDLRVKMTLGAMQQLARYLNAIPGRKNLIWFSGSFPISIAPDPGVQSSFDPMRDYTEEVQETSRMLAAARVAVYPVDARGLMTMPNTSRTPSTTISSVTSSSPSGGGRRSRGGGTTTSSGSRSGVGSDDAKFFQQTQAEQASMREIAEGTGGKAYVNTNGLKEAVANAVENGSSYYAIGYVPLKKDFHGEFRKIQVRIDGSDYKLEYRTGYYADSPGKPGPRTMEQTSLINAAATQGAPLDTGILFRARMLPATDSSFKDVKLTAGPAGEMSASLKQPTVRYVVDFAISPRGIVFTPDDKGALEAKIELLLVGYTSEGGRVNYLDRGFSLSLAEDRYRQVLAHGLPIRMELDMPAGAGFLRAAVHDLTGGNAGSVEAVIQAK